MLIEFNDRGRTVYRPYSDIDKIVIQPEPSDRYRVMLRFKTDAGDYQLGPKGLSWHQAEHIVADMENKSMRMFSIYRQRNANFVAEKTQSRRSEDEDDDY